MEITATVIIAVIMGLVEVLKQTGMNPKFIPLCDVALGVVLSILYSFIVPMPWAEAVVQGLVMGLSACGLYSGIKNMKEGLV